MIKQVTQPKKSSNGKDKADTTNSKGLSKIVDPMNSKSNT